MVTTLPSIFGTSKKDLLSFARKLFAPVIPTSYWKQRSLERGFHGVFYHLTHSEDQRYDLNVIPFWSSMTNLEKQDVQDALGLVDTNSDCLFMLGHMVLQKDPYQEDIIRKDYVFVIRSSDFSYGEFEYPYSDNSLEFGNLPPEHKIIFNDLTNFFAHISPLAYESM